MNSKKDKFIKFNETIINDKKRIVYKKNSLKSKTLYIRSNNEYKKIKNDNKKNGGGLFDMIKKKLGFSVDKIDLFTKEDYDKYNELYNNQYRIFNQSKYYEITYYNFKSYQHHYIVMFVCNNYFIKFLKIEHFNEFKRRFENHPEIKKFLDKCDEKLKAFILGLLTFENFKNIDFDSSDLLQLFRLFFFTTFINNEFSNYLYRKNIVNFKRYFNDKLPKEIIENYWNTAELIKKYRDINLIKNYDIQHGSYELEEINFINLMIRKYSNIDKATTYDDLVEYS